MRLATDAIFVTRRSGNPPLRPSFGKPNRTGGAELVQTQGQSPFSVDGDPLLGSHINRSRKRLPRYLVEGKLRTVNVQEACSS